MGRLPFYVAFMSLTFLMILCFATAALSVALVEEDFESYKVDDVLKGDWEVIGPEPARPTFYVADFPVHAGEKSLRVAYPVGSNETMGVRFDPTMNRISVTCYTYPTSNQQTTFQAILGGNIFVEDPDAPPDPAQDEDSYIGAFITFADDGKVKYYSENGWVDTGTEFNRREWSKVAIEAALDTQTYSVSLNDVTIIRNVPFWHNLDDLSIFAIRRSPQNEGGESFYVDDLVITGSPALVEPKCKLTTTWGRLKLLS